MIHLKPYPSDNYDERPDGAVIKYVILHYTEGDLNQSLAWLTGENPNGQRVSSHYLICEQGDVYQLVPDKKRAWHAGVSSWGADLNLNDTSIGIELVNDGKSPYSEVQMQGLINLLKDIKSRHSILNENILGHEHVAPGRKKDPGSHFDWKRLQSSGLGKFPEKV